MGILLAITLGTVIPAWLIYPPSRSAHAQTPFDLKIQGPPGISRVWLDFAPAPAGSFKATVHIGVDLDAVADLRQLTKFMEPIDVIITFAAPEHGELCVPTCETYFSFDQRELNFLNRRHLSLQPTLNDPRFIPYDQSPIYWMFSVSGHMPDATIATNPVSAQVALPYVDLSQPMAAVAKTTGVSPQVIYGVPLVNSDLYDWSGTVPVPESRNPSGLTLTLRASDLPRAAILSGTNTAQAAADSSHLFLSGVLLGIAGGCVVSLAIEARFPQLRMRKWPGSISSR